MRFFSFFMLVLVALYLPLWSFIIAGCIYAFLFQPFEVCIVAVLIDVTFGDSNHDIWFLYTLASFTIFIFVTHIKPRLRFYQ